VHEEGSGILFPIRIVDKKIGRRGRGGDCFEEWKLIEDYFRKWGSGG